MILTTLNICSPQTRSIKSVKRQTLLLWSSGVWDSFDDSIFKCKHKVAGCIAACARVWKQSEFRGAAQALKVCSVEVRDLRRERKQHAFNLVKSQSRRGFSFQKSSNWGAVHTEDNSLDQGKLFQRHQFVRVFCVWRGHFTGCNREDQGLTGFPQRSPRRAGTR